MSFQSGVTIMPSLDPINTGLRGLSNVANYYAKLYMQQGASDRKELRGQFQQLYAMSLDKLKQDDKEYFNDKLDKFRSKLIEAESDTSYASKRDKLVKLTAERDNLKADIARVGNSYNTMIEELSKFSTYAPPNLFAEIEPRMRKIMATKDPIQRVNEWEQLSQDDVIQWTSVFKGKSVDEYAKSLKATEVKDGAIDWNAIKTRVADEAKMMNTTAWGTYMNWAIGKRKGRDDINAFLDSGNTMVDVDKFSEDVVNKMKAEHYGEFNPTTALKSAFGTLPGRFNSAGKYSSTETRAGIKELYDAGNKDIKQAVDYFKEKDKTLTDDKAIDKLEEYARFISPRDRADAKSTAASSTLSGYTGIKGYQYSEDETDVDFSYGGSGKGYTFDANNKKLWVASTKAKDVNGKDVRFAGEFKLMSLAYDEKTGKIKAEVSAGIPTERTFQHESLVSPAGTNAIQYNSKVYPLEAIDKTTVTLPSGEKKQATHRVKILEGGNLDYSYVIGQTKNGQYILDKIPVTVPSDKRTYVVESVEGDFSKRIDAAFPGLRLSLLKKYVLNPKNKKK